MRVDKREEQKLCYLNSVPVCNVLLSVNESALTLSSAPLAMTDCKQDRQIDGKQDRHNSFVCIVFTWSLYLADAFV